MDADSYYTGRLVFCEILGRRRLVSILRRVGHSIMVVRDIDAGRDRPVWKYQLTPLTPLEELIHGTDYGQ